MVEKKDIWNEQGTEVIARPTLVREAWQALRDWWFVVFIWTVLILLVSHGIFDRMHGISHAGSEPQGYEDPRQ